MCRPWCRFFPPHITPGLGTSLPLPSSPLPSLPPRLKTRRTWPARQRITDALAAVAFDIEHHAGRVDSETGWSYMGIDLSPAPSPAKDASIGEAIENLTKQPFGMSGTMTAAAAITAAIKDVKVKQTG